MDWLSIVLSLGSGLAGVVLGSVITLKERDKEEARLDQAAARVTFFELQENAEYIEAAIKHRRTVPLIARTWPDTRARLAAKLTPVDFVVVGTAYSHIRGIEAAWRDRPLGSGGIGSNTLAATQKTLGLVKEARDLLLAAGWPDPKDRVAVQTKIDE